MPKEITKIKDQRLKIKDRIVWLALAVLIVFVYFFGLTIPLVGPDEPRYAQIGREMFERGDWITPTLGGFGWFEKPALLYWLEIISYHIFGVSEFAARFGSAIFGLATILCLWILGKTVSSFKFQVSSEGQRPKSDFANWLAVIAATSIGMLVFSRAASFDIILTFPITASLVGFFIFDSSQKIEGNDAVNKFSISHFSLLTSYFSLFIFYFFIGIALIAKGLIGIVFPFGIVAFYYLLQWRLPSKKFVFSLLWGTIVSLLVAGVWYLPMFRANGWRFIDEFFVQHHFQRYISNKYFHPQPFWFFFVVLPLMTLPWLPFFLAAIWDIFKVQSPKSKVQSRKSAVSSQQSAVSSQNKFSFSPLLLFSSSPLLLFSLAWLLVPLVFFTFSSSKLPGYILPALPAACILTAEFVNRFAEKSRRREIFLQSAAFVTLFVVIILLEFAAPRYAADDSTKNLLAAANAAGYADAKVLNLHNVAHNAEFYAAGRLIRNADGTLRKFLGVEEVAEEIRRESGAPVLVLVPPEYLEQLTASELVTTRILGKTNELVIAAVRLK